MRIFTGVHIGLIAFAATGAAIMVPTLAPPAVAPTDEASVTPIAASLAAPATAQASATPGSGPIIG